MTWHAAKASKNDLWLKNSHKSALVWLTGLSASGKTSIATELDHKLHESSINSFILDGDNIRHGLNKNLGFSEKDRKENLRRVGEVAKLLVAAGILPIAAFISPYSADRQLIRRLFQPGEFIEVYLNCDIGICEQRDPKGLYKRARNGEIQDFTGISSPYELPEAPEIIVDSGIESIETCVNSIYSYLLKHDIISTEEIQK